ELGERAAVALEEPVEEVAPRRVGERLEDEVVIGHESQPYVTIWSHVKWGVGSPNEYTRRAAGVQRAVQRRARRPGRGRRRRLLHRGRAPALRRPADDPRTRVDRKAVRRLARRRPAPHELRDG